MNFSIRHILSISALLLLLSACSTDERYTEEARIEHSEKMKIVFTLALGNEHATRAADDWEEGDYEPSEPGNEYENYISPGNLQVALYSSDNRFLSNVEKLTFQKAGATNIYRFEGEVDVDRFPDKRLNCKIVVLANVSERFGESLNLSELLFTNLTEYIPMWGVKAVDVTLSAGKTTELGDIYLLRALAKIEVALSPSVTAFTLSSVSLTLHNEYGYCLPEGYDGVSDTRVLNTESCFRTPVQSPLSYPLKFQKDEEGGFFYAYVLEFRNEGIEDAMQSALNLVFDSTLPETFGKQVRMKFVKPDATNRPTTEAMNVVRNHIYRFNITSVKTVEEELDNGKIKADSHVFVKPMEIR